MWTQLRPILAAVLAMLFPGLGHLVLRQWKRALLWFFVVMSGGVALLLLYDVDVAGSGTSPTEAAAALPADVTLPLLLLYGLSALDAYLVGRANIGDRAQAAATTEGVQQHTTGVDGGSGRDGGAPSVAAIADGDTEPPEVECPTCGKKTDAELDFCHWCTEPLPWAGSE